MVKEGVARECGGGGGGGCCCLVGKGAGQLICDIIRGFAVVCSFIFPPPSVREVGVDDVVVIIKSLRWEGVAVAQWFEDDDVVLVEAPLPGEVEFSLDASKGLKRSLEMDGRLIEAPQ